LNNNSEFFVDCYVDVWLAYILQAIGSLQQLTFFDASKNNIETIAPEIENCVSLTDIHLSTNQLLYLPESIGAALFVLITTTTTTTAI